MTASPDKDIALTQLFVLRLWRERAGTPWRAALRAADGAPIGFADLEQLAAWLLRLADGDGAAGGNGGDPSGEQGG